MLVLLVLAGCGRDRDVERPADLVNHWSHSIGDAPSVRVSMMRDGSAVLVIGYYEDMEHALVYMRATGETEWRREER